MCFSFEMIPAVLPEFLSFLSFTNKKQAPKLNCAPLQKVSPSDKGRLYTDGANPYPLFNAEKYYKR